MTNIDVLDQACFDLALSIKMVGQPIASHEARDLANRFAQIAADLVSEPLNIDRPLLARAVTYLTQAHAIPPMGDNTQWFADMLSALIEVARPNSGLDENGKAFLADMLEGINNPIE
jgi:hypothetical protein